MTENVDGEWTNRGGRCITKKTDFQIHVHMYMYLCTAHICILHDTCTCNDTAIGETFLRVLPMVSQALGRSLWLCARLILLAQP